MVINAGFGAILELGLAGLRGELSFTSFRHGGFTEEAGSDLTDVEHALLGATRLPNETRE